MEIKQGLNTEHNVLRVKFNLGANQRHPVHENPAFLFLSCTASVWLTHSELRCAVKHWTLVDSLSHDKSIISDHL